MHPVMILMMKMVVLTIHDDGKFSSSEISDLFLHIFRHKKRLHLITFLLVFFQPANFSFAGVMLVTPVELTSSTRKLLNIEMFANH